MKNYIKKGYYVDIRNTQGYWCAGIVLENDEENVKVRFDGYGVKTDTVCNSLLHLLIKITIETQNKFLSPCSFSSIYRGYLRLTLFFYNNLFRSKGYTGGVRGWREETNYNLGAIQTVSTFE